MCMSVARLQKYLTRPSRLENTAQELVLLADSKGRYLAPFIEPGLNVDVISKSGCNLTEGYYWLDRNINKLLECHGPFTLCVWLGTCDFTSKVNKKLSLKHKSVEECFQQVSRKVERFFQLLLAYP